MADALLVVEDDEDIRTDLVEILARNGYRAAPVANGAEALAYLKIHPPPRLILLDLMMPVMDGCEVMRALVTNAALARVPVIVLSGAGNLVQDAGLLGAVACISKPLLDAIERYTLPAA